MAQTKTRDVAGILRFLTRQQMAEEIVRLDAVIAGRAPNITMGRLPPAPTREPVGVITSMVKGGVTWQTWPDQLMDGTALYARPPCTVCGTPYDKHGSYPTCASHPYTPDGNCQHVIGAACVGAECKNGCVRATPNATKD
jgi:hypothetical protein